LCHKFFSCHRESNVIPLTPQKHCHRTTPPLLLQRAASTLMFPLTTALFGSGSKTIRLGPLINRSNFIPISFFLFLVVTFGGRYSSVIERKYKAYVTKSDRCLISLMFSRVFSNASVEFSNCRPQRVFVALDVGHGSYTYQVSLCTLISFLFQFVCIFPRFLLLCFIIFRRSTSTTSTKLPQLQRVQTLHPPTRFAVLQANKQTKNLTNLGPCEDVSNHP
jgi:hypothetical protein